jgi:sodium transport system permease protein
MNWKKVLIVFKKEIIDTLRDKRTLMVMILVPILLYPMLFATMGQIMTTGAKKLEGQKSVITLNDSIPPQLVRMIRLTDQFEIQDSEDPLEALKSKSIQGFLTLHSADTVEYRIYFDGAIDKSRLCSDRLSEVLREYRRKVQETILIQKKLDLTVIEPFRIRKENIAPPSRMGGMLLGSMLPMLLIVTMMLGAMYPAIDLTAGEKERGTLETILTVPVDRTALLFGKFFTVTMTAFITGLLNLASMMLVYISGLVQMGEIGKHLEFGITLPGLLILLVSLIPFALFVSAAILSVCLFARSFKEAQNFVTPVYLLLMFPSFISFMPGVELNRSLALIPVINISLLFREVFLSHYPLELISLTFLANTVIAILFITTVVKLFNAESVLFGEGSIQFTLNRERIKRASVFDTGSSLLIFAGIMLLLFYIGSTVQLKSITTGLLITEWGLIFLPVMLSISYFKIDLKQCLQLKWPGWMFWPGTLLAGVGAFGFMIWISWIQMRIFPEYEELIKSMQDILNISVLHVHPAIGLFIFALSPAICEETLFRGVLLSAFKKRMPGWMSVLAVGCLFGLFHVHLYRLLPTALLGILFSYIVYRSGSLWPAVLAHFVNNGIVFLIVNYPALLEKLPWLSEDASPAPLPTVVLSGSFIMGIMLIEMGKKSEEAGRIRRSEI